MANEILTNPLTERFPAAFEYANRVHRTQSRKGTEVPYIAHPLAVAALVLEDGGDEEEAIAALLHDTLEDGDGAARDEVAKDIAMRFGYRVLEIVKGCSEDEVRGGRGLETHRLRKEAYIAKLEHEPLGVLRVSLADKVHNARAILRDYREHGEALWDRFNAGRESQLWYYRSLAGLYLRLKPGPLAKELERIVEELERSAAPR